MTWAGIGRFPPILGTVLAFSNCHADTHAQFKKTIVMLYYSNPKQLDPT